MNCLTLSAITEQETCSLSCVRKLKKKIISSTKFNLRASNVSLGILTVRSIFNRKNLIVKWLQYFFAVLSPTLRHVEYMPLCCKVVILHNAKPALCAKTFFSPLFGISMIRRKKSKKTQQLFCFPMLRHISSNQAFRYFIPLPKTCIQAGSTQPHTYLQPSNL